MDINLLQHLRDFNRHLEERSGNYQSHFITKERTSEKICNCKNDPKKMKGYCQTCNGWVS